MKAPRLLLLMNGTAGDSGIGNLFVEALARHYPHGTMVRFSTCNGGPPRRAEWCGGAIRYGRICAIPYPPLSTATDALLRRFRLPGLVEEIAECASAHRVDGILAVLNAPSVIHAALPLASRTRLPLYAMVWDPPEYLALNLGLGKAAARRLYHAFDTTLCAAKSLAVIGEPMADRYSRSFRGQAVTIRHGIHPDLWRLGRQRCRTGAFVIGFAGSLYAKAEWRALLAALELVGYEICGRPVIVKLLGRVPLRGVSLPQRVECTGSLSLEDTIATLSEADVSYLPYWFDTQHADIVRLSFPSKLSTYAAAAAPVLYHGPHDSSPVPFLKRYPMGANCHSLEPRAIVEVLRRLASDDDLYRVASAACRQALVHELGLESMLLRFSRLLGITREALLPVQSLAHVPAPRSLTEIGKVVTA